MTTTLFLLLFKNEHGLRKANLLRTSAAGRSGEAASLAELIFCAICSWVIRSVLLPVRSDSETRNSAKRLSRLLNIICCICYITSEKRFTASSYKKHFIFIFLSFNSAIALAGTMKTSVSCFAVIKLSNVIWLITHDAESTQISFGYSRNNVISLPSSESRYVRISPDMTKNIPRQSFPEP